MNALNLNMQILRRTRVIFLLVFVFIFYESFGQTITKKELTRKWSINFMIDSVKAGDTMVFSRDIKYKNYYLKSNQELNEHTWYAHCGNKYFMDYFTPKPPKWRSIGSWSVSTDNKKTFLTMKTEKRVYTFALIGRNKKQISFICK